MKRIGFCFALLLLLGCPALAQEARITLKLSTQRKQQLPGEPLWVQVTLTNDGPGSAKLIGSCGDVIGPADYGSNCKRAILVQKPGGKVMVGGWSPSCIPATPLPAGQSVVCNTNLGGEELKIFQSPGVYEIWAEYQGPSPRGGAHMADEPAPITHFWKGFAKSNTVEITVVSPTGVDRQAYDTYLKPYATGKKRLLNSYTGRESVMVKGHSEIKGENLLNAILKRFPTSTYAGYALRARIPALAREALTDLNNPDGTLRRWSDRGGSEATIQGHITKVQSAMRTYAEAAGVFLRAHPDFAYASEIRRGYAMCLGLTGHMPEAMAELQTLGEGSGKEAQEAKAYLGETPKKKVQKRITQTP